MKRAKAALIVGLFATVLAISGSSEATSITITANPVGGSSWELTIEADIVIADGAIGIVNAVSFTPNSSASDTFFSCLFQTCGTQGPGATGSGVVSNAVYFAWASAGDVATPFAYGDNVGSPQLMGTFTSGGPVSLTFGGLNALFGNDESQPMSDFPTFDPVSVSDITLRVVPEPATALLFASGILALALGRARRG